MWPWRAKMPTQNLLRLLLLLMLVMRIVLTTVCCRYRSWGLVIKLIFCSDFGQKVWSTFWRYSSGTILKLGLVNIFNFKFSQDTNVWLTFWSHCLVEILKIKFDQDLCLNLFYDPLGYFCKLNSTLGSVVHLAMFHLKLCTSFRQCIGSK